MSRFLFYMSLIFLGSSVFGNGKIQDSGHFIFAQNYLVLCGSIGEPNKKILEDLIFSIDTVYKGKGMGVDIENMAKELAEPNISLAKGKFGKAFVERLARKKGLSAFKVVGPGTVFSIEGEKVDCSSSGGKPLDSIGASD